MSPLKSSAARLDAAVIAAVQANPDAGYLVDAPYPGAPLVITFGYISWDTVPNFDFVGRTSKLEATTGQRINRILLRDPANFWYLHGVPGLGCDVDTVAAALRRLIAEIDPISVTTVGQSMGGYAAVLFGALLDVDQVLAFGALSYFRSDWARRDGDTRWLPVMETLDRFPPAQRYDDLPALLLARRAIQSRLPSIRLVYGTGPEPDGTSINLDGLHAARYRAVPGVIIDEIAASGHAVVHWLIAAKQIDALLEQGILPANLPSAPGSKPAPVATPPDHEFRDFNDGWRSWIGENLALGASREGLLQDLVAQGFHPGETQREIDKAHRSPYLQCARSLARQLNGLD